MSLSPGTRLGPYEILFAIGAGGMGEVWLASDVPLGRKVVLKFLPNELSSGSSRVRRFEQEARAASALNHPSVCHIYGLGVAPDGQQFIAMEYVEGETLRNVLHRGPLAVTHALDVAIHVASALVAAHAAGVVHRDLKPENIVLRSDGVVKVVDFGLAKIGVAHPPGASTGTAFETEMGQVLGTIAYMSPEQARGQQVDARADIWGLGVVLFEMVAGRQPFQGATATDVLVAILGWEPASVSRFDPTAPQELHRIIRKALRKEQLQRYQTAHDLLLDLQAVRDELRTRSATVAAPAPLPPFAATSSSAQRRILVVESILALLTLAIAGLWLASAHRQNGLREPAQRQLTRLTFEPGLDTDPTFSPDGRMVAYASDRGGNFDVWVKSVTGGNAVQVTTSPAADTQPSWSPDSSLIAFRSGSLWVLDRQSGESHLLTTNGSDPSWAPTASTWPTPEVLSTLVPTHSAAR